MGQSKHGFGTLIDPFRWLVAFFPTPMHVRRPQEAKKNYNKFDPKIPKPPPTRPLCVGQLLQLLQYASDQSCEEKCSIVPSEGFSIALFHRHFSD